ncbi:MAG: hypothetical protein MJ237_01515 [bacterium]|nr:hypothetical protein [bacterium]
MNHSYVPAPNFTNTNFTYNDSAFRVAFNPLTGNNSTPNFANATFLYKNPPFQATFNRLTANTPAPFSAEVIFSKYTFSPKTTNLFNLKWTQPTNNNKHLSTLYSQTINQPKTFGDTFEKNTPLKSSEEIFEEAIKLVLAREGGLANLNDGGGLTNYGVTTNTYNAYRKKHNLPIQSVAKITMDEVKEIYRNFWVKSGADKIEDEGLAIMVFDTAINMGCSAAKKMLKPDDNLESYTQKRKQRYRDLATNNPQRNQKFLKGWLNRVDKINDGISALV